MATATATTTTTAPVSRTAQYVALYRALETIERRRDPLFRDDLAIRFLSRPLGFAVRAAARSKRLHTLVDRYADYRAPGARTSAIARTAIIDRAVKKAVSENEIDQLVVLGAGFDCRAHRMSELAGVSVYEVDRAATQAEKRARVPSAAITYVAVDFLKDDVRERLRASGWNDEKPTIFLWEGVTGYLTEESVHATLAWIGKTAPRSVLVFTYLHGGLIDGTEPFEGAEKMLSNVRALGEPWKFGIHPRDLAPLCSRFGLIVRDDMGADEYRERAGFDKRTSRGYAFYRLAVTEVST
jgi:methyltransferase (TIGR00027 family)